MKISNLIYTKFGILPIFMKKSINQIIRELKALFKEEELKFRVGDTNLNKTMDQALDYVEARSIQNRLDKVGGIESILQRS
jgi:hypothetical protein